MMNDATYSGPVKNKSHRGDITAAFLIIYFSSLASAFFYVQGAGTSAGGELGSIVIFLAFILWTLVFIALATIALILNRKILFQKTILIACVVNVLSSIFVVGEYSNDGSNEIGSYYEEAGKTFLWKKYPNGTELPFGVSFLGSLSFFVQLVFFVLMIILIGNSLEMKDKADFNKNAINS